MNAEPLQESPSCSFKRDPAGEENMRAYREGRSPGRSDGEFPNVGNEIPGHQSGL